MPSPLLPERSHVSRAPSTREMGRLGSNTRRNDQRNFGHGAHLLRSRSLSPSKFYHEHRRVHWRMVQTNETSSTQEYRNSPCDYSKVTLSVSLQVLRLRTMAPTLSHSSIGTPRFLQDLRPVVLYSADLAFVQGLRLVKLLLYPLIWLWQVSHFRGRRNRDSCTLSRTGNPRFCYMFGLYSLYECMSHHPPRTKKSGKNIKYAPRYAHTTVLGVLSLSHPFTLYFGTSWHNRHTVLSRLRGLPDTELCGGSSIGLNTLSFNSGTVDLYQHIPV
ncbi:hypothetical protein EDB89DRAFT_1943965 [Lactarius sanguifluus]|nr:hypothetical protein EDB89DRAFT_1943965 [Lactarius sanguifluus]